MSLTRRRFLQTSSALALSASAYARAADSPSETVRVAVMGARIRGKFHLGAFPAVPNTEVTHIIEPDESLIPEALAILAKKQKSVPKIETDVRKVLDDKSLTALIVAAPDHWHALATVWACQAGKHVYVEKPCSHNIVEGRRMVEAARKYKRVVQVGTQRRSADHVIAAREFVQSGKLGKVPFARGLDRGEPPQYRQAGQRRGAEGHRLLALDRPREAARFQPEPLPLQLALVLGVRHRRDRQQRHPHARRGPQRPEPGRPDAGDQFGRPSSSTTTTNKPRTPQIATFDFPTCTLVWGTPHLGEGRHGRRTVRGFDSRRKGNARVHQERLGSAGRRHRDPQARHRD